MKVHEYQAKELLAQYGVPVPRGRVARRRQRRGRSPRSWACPSSSRRRSTPAAAARAAASSSPPRPDEAEAAAAQIIGMTLVTPQTGPRAASCARVLVEEQTQIERELYLAVLIDSQHRPRRSSWARPPAAWRSRRSRPRTRRRSTASPSTRRPASSPTRAASWPSRSASAATCCGPATALMASLYNAASSRRTARWPRSTRWS